MNSSRSVPRSELHARLQARREEIEGVVLDRVRSIASAASMEDGEYGDGMRSAVSAGVGHGLVTSKGVEVADGPVPSPLLVQARQAASRGVPLDIVLRRYFAAYVSFTDFVVRTAEEVELGRLALRPILADQAARFERITVAVSSEYTRERGHRGRSPAQRRSELVMRMLAGQHTGGVSNLGYDLDGWHLGIVGRGDGAVCTLKNLTQASECQTLFVRPRTAAVWVWLGARQRASLMEVANGIAPTVEDAVLAMGEPARGMEGWRLTHQQASAALRVAQGDTTGVVRYADVGLLASISQDHVLVDSLHTLYVAPLAVGRTDGGASLRVTLNAYFGAGRNVSSAAAALGVSRQTVANRLRAVEERLGRTIESCAPELEVALRMDLPRRGRIAPHAADQSPGLE